MPPTNDDLAPLFDRSRTAELMHRASLLQQDARDRISLAELRSIAIEVGIDVKYLDRAIAEAERDAGELARHEVTSTAKGLAILGAVAGGIGGIAIPGLMRIAPMLDSRWIGLGVMGGLAVVGWKIALTTALSQRYRKFMSYQAAAWSSLGVVMAFTFSDGPQVVLMAAAISTGLGACLAWFRKRRDGGNVERLKNDHERDETLPVDKLGDVIRRLEFSGLMIQPA